MLKRNSKLLIVLFIILTVVSSFSLCFATQTNEPVTTSETNTDVASQETEENIHEGDLYLFDNNITMDQLVDGNVYIMGRNITVSGQVNGNLFVFGDSVKFDNCYVRYSIYACANNLYYNGACNDLYAAAQKLEMTYDSYVVRDVKAVSNSTIFKAAIGRDVDLETNTLDLGSDKETPIIYGNLRYSANEEKTIADGIVEGEVTYSSAKITNNKSISENIGDVVIAFLMVVLTTLVIYAIASKVKPEYFEKMSNTFSASHLLKCFGIGLLTLIAGIVISFILLMTTIGVKLSFILVFILLLLGFVATPVAMIYITNLLKPVLKVEKTYLYYLVLALVAIIFHGLTFIPFVGSWIGFIGFTLGYGLIINSALPHKELSEEEIAVKLAAKEEKQALKAQKKEERAKLNAAKKEEKAKLKEAKKAEKNNKED